MTKETNKKERTQITFGLILGWVLSLIFTLIGVVGFFTSSFIGGFLMIIGALSIFPPISNTINEKFHFGLSKGIKVFIFIILIMSGFILIINSSAKIKDIQNINNTMIKNEAKANDSEEDNKTRVSNETRIKDIQERNNSIIKNEIGQGFLECNTPDCWIDISSQYAKSADINQLKKIIVWVKYEVRVKNVAGDTFRTTYSGSGVIYTKDQTRLLIFTNRHVIDCKYNHDEHCYQKDLEDIKVRTFDGKIYDVSRVLYEPNDLDIALLEIKTNETYEVAPLQRDDPDYEDEVIAMGFPTAKLEGGYTEFSITAGKITKKREIISPNGIAFEIFESDAYINSGSSGGGLFLEEAGKLVGITTWGNLFETAAINLHIISNINSYRYCKNGTYLVEDKCIKRCSEREYLTSDYKCKNSIF